MNNEKPKTEKVESKKELYFTSDASVYASSLEEAQKLLSNNSKK